MACKTFIWMNLSWLLYSCSYGKTASCSREEYWMRTTPCMSETRRWKKTHPLMHGAPLRISHAKNMGHAWWQHAVHKCTHSFLLPRHRLHLMSRWHHATWWIARRAAAQFCHLRARSRYLFFLKFVWKHATPFDTRRHGSRPAPLTLLLLLLWLWLFNCTHSHFAFRFIACWVLK